MKNILFIFFLLMNISAFSQEINYKERAEKNIHLLIRNEVLHEQVRIDDTGVKMYANKSDKKKDNYEFFIPWEMTEEFVFLFDKNNSQKELNDIYKNNKIFKTYKRGDSSKNKKKGIKGKTIVLDPGHFANNFKTAVLERKFMKMKGSELGQKKDICFYEADLAYRTAKILKKRLE
ncbi:MAG: hypothetical protein ACPG5P_08350, partial [Saprospiraceae bacterium]